VGRGAVLIEGLIGISIDLIACRGDIVFLERANLGAKDLEGCIGDLRGLPPLPSIVDMLNIGERFWTLETIMLLDQFGAAHLNRVVGIVNMKPVCWFADDILDGIDWNPGLAVLNKWYDRVVAAGNERNRTKRNQQLLEIDREWNSLGHSLKEGDGGAALKDSGSPPASRGQAVGEVLIVLLMPAARKVLDAADRSLQTAENVITAFALIWHRRATGHYPERLADLAPTYLPQAPKDLFTGKQLVYQPTANGFVLYSFGTNGVDDSGKGDDLVVRIPQPDKP
jgi:hypothetical protein